MSDDAKFFLGVISLLVGLVVFVLLAMRGCNGSKSMAVKELPEYSTGFGVSNVSKIMVEGHRYVVWRQGYGLGMAHDPDCECNVGKCGCKCGECAKEANGENGEAEAKGN